MFQLAFLVSAGASQPPEKAIRLLAAQSICRSIIEAHGGKLTAAANVPRGKVFRFTIPATDSATF